MGTLGGMGTSGVTAGGELSLPAIPYPAYRPCPAHPGCPDRPARPGYPACSAPSSPTCPTLPPRRARRPRGGHQRLFLFGDRLDSRATEENWEVVTARP